MDQRRNRGRKSQRSRSNRNGIFAAAATIGQVQVASPEVTKDVADIVESQNRKQTENHQLSLQQPAVAVDNGFVDGSVAKQGSDYEYLADGVSNKAESNEAVLVEFSSPQLVVDKPTELADVRIYHRKPLPACTGPNEQGAEYVAEGARAYVRYHTKNEDFEDVDLALYNILFSHWFANESATRMWDKRGISYATTSPEEFKKRGGVLGPKDYSVLEDADWNYLYELYSYLAPNFVGVDFPRYVAIRKLALCQNYDTGFEFPLTEQCDTRDKETWARIFDAKDMEEFKEKGIRAIAKANEYFATNKGTAQALIVCEDKDLQGWMSAFAEDASSYNLESPSLENPEVEEVILDQGINQAMVRVAHCESGKEVWGWQNLQLLRLPHLAETKVKVGDELDGYLYVKFGLTYKEVNKSGPLDVDQSSFLDRLSKFVELDLIQFMAQNGINCVAYNNGLLFTSNRQSDNQMEMRLREFLNKAALSSEWLMTHLERAHRLYEESRTFKYDQTATIGPEHVFQIIQGKNDFSRSGEMFSWCEQNIEEMQRILNAYLKDTFITVAKCSGLVSSAEMPNNLEHFTSAAKMATPAFIDLDEKNIDLVSFRKLRERPLLTYSSRNPAVIRDLKVLPFKL